MKKLSKLLINLPFGIFIGATISLILAWSLDNEVALNINRMKVYVFGSVLTMIAAAITLAGVLSNLNFQREQVEENRKLKAQSARAVLPNALSLFMDVTRHGLHYNYLFSATGVISGLTDNTDASILALPKDTVKIFRELIENSSDERLRNHLFEILREHQVLVARSNGRGLGRGSSASNEDYRHVAHWAYLSALAGIIFDYARGRTLTIERTLSETTIQGQLHFEDFFFGPEQQELYQGAIGLYSRTYQKRLG